MTSVLAAWTVFRRLHLRALAADRWKSALSVAGVALGITLLLGVLVLRAELVRPFDAFGPAMTAGTTAQVVQVVPEVGGRLSDELVARLEAELPEARAVVPLVAGLVPVEVDGERHGFFVMGGPCTIELLVGPFDCERRALTEAPADGPGMPLEVPAKVADDLGLRLGDTVNVPGQADGAAHLGWTFPEFDRVAGINDGRVLFAADSRRAAELLGSPGYVTVAFVVGHEGSGVDLTDRVRAVAGDAATVGPPRPQRPTIFATGQQSLTTTALSGILVGLLIALNSILLAVRSRRPVMGTVGAIGASPRRLLVGFLGEGVLLGVVGGTLAVPAGFQLGTFLVHRFGLAMLDGSGASVRATFDPSLILVGVAAGAACGMLAMVGPAWRMLREGPLALMSSFGSESRSRGVPWWVPLTGLAVLAASTWLVVRFGRGEASMDTGSTALTTALVGYLGVVVWLLPIVAAGASRLLAAAWPAVGRLLTADLRRYAVSIATTAGVLAVGATLALGSQTMQHLAAEQVAGQHAARLPTSLVVSAQGLLDQREAQISDEVAQAVRTASGTTRVDERWRVTLPSDTEPRLVVGLEPGSVMRRAQYPAIGSDTDPGLDLALDAGLARGEVALSEIAAGRLDGDVGGTVTLPTVHGPREFRVAGLVRPEIVDDTTLGDVVLASDATAREHWAATRDRLVLTYSSADEATAHVPELRALGSGLHVLDSEEWGRSARSGVTRFFEPYTVTGYVMMAAAGLGVLTTFLLGLIQRRRERAVLSAIGATAGQLRAVVAATALVVAVSAAVLGVLGGWGLVALQSLASPVFYGVTVRWGVVAAPALLVVAVLAAQVAVAAAYPLVRTGRREPLEALREE